MNIVYNRIVIIEWNMVQQNDVILVNVCCNEQDVIPQSGFTNVKSIIQPAKKEEMRRDQH